jgi:hypothetical protein
MPYSAGRTTTNRITQATISAMTVAVMIFAIEGASICDLRSMSVIAPPHIR